MNNVKKDYMTAYYREWYQPPANHTYPILKNYPDNKNRIR